MDEESIQEGAPIVSRREPAYGREKPLDRFSSETLEKDKKNLYTLSVFYYVLAGFAAVGAVLSPLYIAIGIVFLLSVPTTPSGPPPELGYIFIGIGIFALVLNSVYAYLLYLCGKS